MNDFLLKLALPTIAPKASTMAKAIGEHLPIPKPGKLPGAISAAFKDAPKPSPTLSAVGQVMGTIPAPKGSIDGVVKAASVAFFDELAQIDPELAEKVAAADVEELLKVALSVPGMGQMGAALKGIAGGAAKGLGGALQGARGGIANVAGKISPTLNKPVMQAAQGAAHSLQKSPNSFAQGVGNIMAHKVHTPGKAFLAAANPVGTAAEMVAGGAGTAASKGLSAAGGRLQAATGAGDAIARQGRAMTPKGRLLNAAEAVGGRVQRTFSPGGTGHNVLTKHVPLAAELGGAVGAGMALHAPVGLAGVAGKMGLLGAGKAVPAIGAALEHAPAAVDAMAHKVGPALKGVGGALHHAAEDVLGTKGQGLLGRLGGRGAAHAAHSMLPEAGHSMLPAAAGVAGASMIPRPPPMPKFGSALDTAKSVGHSALHALHKYEDPIELAGLGVLAAPGIDSMVAGHRARKAGYSPDDHHAVDKFRLMKERHHDAIDVGGLGVLAAPLVAKRAITGKWTS